MPQLSLYIDDSTMEMLRSKSDLSHKSMSKYVAQLIQESESNFHWPKGYWDSVYGCLKDPTFVAPDDVDVPLDDIDLFE